MYSGDVVHQLDMLLGRVWTVVVSCYVAMYIWWWHDALHDKHTGFIGLHFVEEYRIFGPTMTHDSRHRSNFPTARWNDGKVPEMACFLDG